MANLYKMTLYVCDLEEDLNINEIKNLISDRALDGVSVSCICHFSDEKVGPTIEWDDDIDLNNRNSTTEQWEKYFDENKYDGCEYCYDEIPFDREDMECKIQHPIEDREDIIHPNYCPKCGRPLNTSKENIVEDIYNLKNIESIKNAENIWCKIFPFKIGDKVYIINNGDYNNLHKPYIQEKNITEISWKTNRSGKDLGFGIILEGGTRYKISNIGKSVFLTKESAKKFLDKNIKNRDI